MHPILHWCKNSRKVLNQNHTGLDVESPLAWQMWGWRNVMIDSNKIKTKEDQESNQWDLNWSMSPGNGTAGSRVSHSWRETETK